MNLKEIIKNSSKPFMLGFTIAIIVFSMSIPIFQNPSYGRIIQANGEIAELYNTTKNELNYCQQLNDANTKQFNANVIYIIRFLNSTHCSDEGIAYVMKTINTSFEKTNYGNFTIPEESNKTKELI